jgi:hypothetical protein
VLIALLVQYNKNEEKKLQKQESIQQADSLNCNKNFLVVAIDTEPGNSE